MNGKQIDKTPGFWGRTFKKLQSACASPRRRRRSGLAPLLELEDRRLLSGAPPVVDTTSSAATAAGGASSLTFAHTVKSGSNIILIVDVAVKTGNATDPVTSVTYGGQSLTLAGSAVTPNSMSADIWYLVNPTVGTANVVVTLNGSNHFVAGATDYFGVNQTTPLGTLVTATGTSSSPPSVSVVSTPGELVVESIVAQGSAGAISPSGAGQNELWTQATGTSAGDALGAGAEAPAPTPNALTWTETTDQAWALAAVPLLSAPTSAPGFTVTPTTLQTSQAGAAASFTVSLASAPADTVTINLTNNDPSQGSLSGSSLTFTTSNWNTPQTVTVTGVNDNIAAGNQTYQVTGTASSTDANYNNLAMTPVTVTNVQTDVAGITITGSTFLAAEDNNVVRVNAQTGAIVATYATGVANDGVAVGPSGDIYVADYSANEILYYDPTGKLLGNFGSSELISPQGLTFGPNGNLFVTCTNGPNNGFVDEFTPSGAFVTQFIAPGVGGLSNAKDIVWGPNGNAYVSSYDNSEILQYNGATGAVIGVFATAPGGLEQIAFGPNGNLYAAGYGNGAIYEFNGSTGALTTFASGIATPYGLYFDPAGNLDVSSRSTGDVLQYDAGGTLIGTLDSGLTNPAYLAATTSLVTTQSGASATFTVQLNTEPIDPVTITLNNGAPSQGSLSTTTLTFNASNWNTPQTVTVTGLNDNIADGSQFYQITGTASSSDANYSGMAMAPVTVTNIQTDVAGFTVTPTSIQTSMAGASASFNVALTSEPLDPVTVTLSSTDPSEGTLSQSSLTFNASDWSTPQSVTVTGQADFGAGGNVNYQITGTASSSDATYNNLAMTPVNVTNVDTNLPGLIVTPTTLTTTQSGGTASFTVALTTEPTLLGLPLLGIGSVTVTFTNGDPTQGSLSTSSIWFDASNWNVPQTITVTGLNDNIADGNQTYQITGASSSALDTSYNGLTMTPVTVTNVQTDVAGINVTPTSVTTSQAGAAGSFAVSLTSEPLDPVTINLTNGAPTQGSLSATSLTFNPSDWNTPQNVTVTGLNDNIAQGNVNYQITGTASSTDANYNDMATTPVTVTNVGTVAGFNVTPTSLTTSEGGTQASFTVALTSAPVAPVTVSLQPSDPTQGILSQSALTFNASDWSNPQTVTVTGLDSYMTTPSVTYQITGSASSADANYNAVSMTPVSVTNDETPNASSVSVVSSASPSVYGTAITFTAKVSAVAPMTGTPTGSVTFLDGAADLGTATLSGGSATFTTDAFAAGNHTVTVSYGGDAYFDPDTSSALTQTVTPATLTVAANAQTKAYGAGDPALTYVASGFQLSDTAASVLTGALARAAGENVGSYAINQGTLAADSNYTISFTGNNLSITPATLTVAANPETKVYGASDPTMTYTASGFQFSDTAATVLTGALARAAGENVGSYAINQGTLAADANYTISFTGNHLAITPATLTVAANPATKVYGASDPTLTYAASGFQFSDTAASVLTGALARAAGENVGSYAINQGTLAADANYTIGFTGNNLSITPATLTVTANNVSKVYGQPNPTLTDSIAGFVNSDPASVVTGNASLTTAATANSAVGSYAINAAQGSLAAANYNFAFANGTLTVTPVLLATPPTPVPAPPATAPSVPTTYIGLFGPAPTSTPTNLSNPSSNVNAAGESGAAGNAVKSAGVRTLALASDASLSIGAGVPLQTHLPITNRAVEGFAPVPRSAWLESGSVQVAVWMPADDEIRFEAIPVSALTALSAPARVQTEQADVVLDVLSESGERIPWTDGARETTALVGAGVLATTGYVLLNTRLGLWLLSLLTSRPLWKQFDPLEVLYAWEENAQQADDDTEDKETLVTLVDEW